MSFGLKLLLNKMRGKVRVFFFYIILYLISQVAYNENELIDAGLVKLVDNNAQDCFTCEGDERFWLSICMWPQLSACSCHGNDCFHKFLKKKS